MRRCVCCWGTKFIQHQVLWPELIDEWGLSEDEASYINRQQGYACERCRCNLRSMALAAAIMRARRARGPFMRFVLTHPNLRVLEINPAGGLKRFLKLMPRHTLMSYPAVDMMDLPVEDRSFDLVVHSDTLEHVPDPLQGLRESYRVLRRGGATCYTVPAVVGRLTTHREGKPPSHHGTSASPDHLVINEYGADMWTQPLQAGFKSCVIESLEYPGGLAMIATKR